MDIVSYAKKYNDDLFLEQPFTHVDALLMCMFSYMNFELVTNDTWNENEAFFIRDIKEEDIDAVCANEMLTKGELKLLKASRLSKRYGSIQVKYIRNLYDVEKELQFYGVTFLLPNDVPVITFRGTDLTAVGWKENFNLARMDEVPAQKEALKYIEEIAQTFDGPFYVAGQSKGACLSLYGGVYSSTTNQDRMVNIYCFDGPGFRKGDYLTSDNYLRVKNKIVQIVPSDDVVGMLLITPPGALVVKSWGVYVFQHNPFLWRINRKYDFIYVKKSTWLTTIRKQTINTFIRSLSEEELEVTVRWVISLLGGIESKLYEFFKRHKFISYYLTRVRTQLSKEDKNILKRVFKKFKNIYFHYFFKRNKKAKNQKKA